MRNSICVLAILVFSTVLAGAVPTWAAQSLPRVDGHMTPLREFGGKSTDCEPLAILSPGFGGTENGLALLARELTSAGYHVLVMGHVESGRVQLREVLQAVDRRSALIARVGDPAAHRARFMDLDATWTHAMDACTPPFTVLIGHSMGAQTTMIEAGANAMIGPMGANRFDAYVALSPSGVGLWFSIGPWRAISKPVLMVTGTLDRGIDGDYTTRAAAFDSLPAGRKRLAVIKGATHMNVGTRGNRALAGLVPKIVLAFLADIRAGRNGPITPLPGVTFRIK